MGSRLMFEAGPRQYYKRRMIWLLSLLRACLDSKKFYVVLVISNLTAHAWSTKCRRKKKLITQLAEKS